jgi:hypothetical protein
MTAPAGPASQRHVETSITLAKGETLTVAHLIQLTTDAAAVGLPVEATVRVENRISGKPMRLTVAGEAPVTVSRHD